jgi:hypothetical protein
MPHLAALNADPLAPPVADPVGQGSTVDLALDESLLEKPDGTQPTEEEMQDSLVNTNLKQSLPVVGQALTIGQDLTEDPPDRDEDPGHEITGETTRTSESAANEDVQPQVTLAGTNGHETVDTRPGLLDGLGAGGLLLVGIAVIVVLLLAAR